MAACLNLVRGLRLAAELAVSLRRRGAAGLQHHNLACLPLQHLRELLMVGAQCCPALRALDAADRGWRLLGDLHLLSVMALHRRGHADQDWLEPCMTSTAARFWEL